MDRRRRLDRPRPPPRRRLLDALRLKLDPAVVAEKLGHAEPAFTVKRYVGIRRNPDERATQITESW